MEPYYSRAGVTLYLGDCRDVLPTLAKGSAGVLVTDPPYGMGYQSNYGKNHDAIVGDDDASWVPEAIAAACRVLRVKRHAYVFGPPALVGPPLVAAVEMVWDKGAVGMGDLTLPWAPQHEPITFAAHYPHTEKNTKRGGGVARLRAGSILAYPRPQAKRHPTEKPVELLCRLIESSSLLGEIVLDPFAGVGSTLVAAVVERRHAVGIEIEEKYAETAAKRCDAALNWLESASSF